MVWAEWIAVTRLCQHIAQRGALAQESCVHPERSPLRMPEAANSSASRLMSAGVQMSGIWLSGSPPRSTLIMSFYSKRGCRSSI